VRRRTGGISRPAVKVHLTKCTLKPAETLASRLLGGRFSPRARPLEPRLAEGRVRGRDPRRPRSKGSLLFREKKTRQHREITREAAYKGFVIGDFPPNRVALHFCQPALNFSACVRLLPVEALAAPHGPGYVTTVRHINHRAPNARLIGHLSRGPEGVGRGLFLHGQFLRNRHKTAKMLELSQ